MAKTPEAVNSFLDEVYAKVAPLEKQDVEELRQFKAETLKFRWKKQRLSAGAKATGVKNCVRPNIRWTRKNCVIISRLKRRKMVICGFFRLYGIEFKPVKVKAWHDEVEYYAVHDKATGEFMGGLYVDKYPREGKYGHAAVWGVYGGSRLNHRRPVSVLVTNFNRKGLNSNELEPLCMKWVMRCMEFIEDPLYRAVRYIGRA